MTTRFFPSVSNGMNLVVRIPEEFFRGKREEPR
jgi:hypothetical protein